MSNNILLEIIKTRKTNSQQYVTGIANYTGIKMETIYENSTVCTIQC